MSIREDGHTFALLGEQAQGQSTVAGRNCAMSQLNLYFIKAGILDHDKKPLQLGVRDEASDRQFQTPELERILCNKDNLRFIGDFMTNYATKLNSNEIFVPGSYIVNKIYLFL